MIDSTKISCTVASTDYQCPLGMEVWLDSQQLFNSDHVAESMDLEWPIVDDEAEHELRFVMKNKTIDHTQVDAQGTITQDARLIVQNVCFDEIALGQLFIDHTEYTHDFNGTQPMTTVKFYGEMGCNGTVSLKFRTPIYLWLLENM